MFQRIFIIFHHLPEMLLCRWIVQNHLLTVYLTALIFSLPRISPCTLIGCDKPKMKTCIEGILSPKFFLCEIPKITFIENGPKDVAKACWRFDFIHLLIRRFKVCARVEICGMKVTTKHPKSVYWSIP